MSLLAIANQLVFKVVLWSNKFTSLFPSDFKRVFVWHLTGKMLSFEFYPKAVFFECKFRISRPAIVHVQNWPIGLQRVESRIRWRQRLTSLKIEACKRSSLYMQNNSLKALANEEDTLLRTQMFPRLPAHATFVADTDFVPGTQKMCLILFRNILCPHQMFPSLRSPRNIKDNNVSATMCPRLPGP